MRALTKTFMNILDTQGGTWDEDEQIKRVSTLSTLDGRALTIKCKCTIAHNMATMSESNDYWSGPAMFAQDMLGIWFAASHQPWMNLNFILMEACARPDCQEAIRQELLNSAPLDGYKKLDDLPLLDSFMKETVRFTPLDTMGIRRKAVLPYNFRDGTLSVPLGATVCVPAEQMMHDATRYPDPSKFDGTRFVPGGQDPRKFTQVAHDFPMWGFGSLAW